MEPDQLYNMGFVPPEMQMAKRLPSWYHGMISRQEAELLLRKNNPCVDGLFLIRKSSKDKGFVLSVVQMAEMAHYQIRHEVLDGRDYLTFDTETDRGPLFRSLSGVLHYLLNQPTLLPIPLTQWVTCMNDPGLPHLGREAIAFRGDISQTLTDALSDTLAEVTGGSAEDLYEEPAVYAMRNPSALSNKPRFQVLWNVSSSIALKANDIITMIRTELDGHGRKIIVVADEDGKQHRLESDSKDIEVIPFKMSTYSAPSERAAKNMSSTSLRRERERSRKIHSDGSKSKSSLNSGSSSTGSSTSPTAPVPPPALPRRQTALQNSTAKGYHQFQPSMSGPGSRQMSPAAGSVDDGYYYREVIKEGYLRKLPPQGNLMQSWKMRWFKLVVVISSSESVGPIVLEYYDKPTTRNPRGVINLSLVKRICTVEPGDRRARALKRTDHVLLFMIQLPRRTYPLQGGSSGEVSEWVSALNDTLGLDPSGSKIEPERPPATRTEIVKFNGKLVFGGQDGRSGFPCVIEIRPDKFTVEGSRSDQRLSWAFTDLQRFGFVKQLMWFDAGIQCEFPGIYCVSTPDAEAMWAAVEDRVKLISDPETLSRGRSLRSNMSWTLKSMIDNATAAQPDPSHATSTIKVFGRMIPSSDLGYGGVTIATRAYTAKKPEELTLAKDDENNVLKTRAFLADGYWVKEITNEQKTRRKSLDGRKFVLIKANCVEHYEHGFSDLAEDEDVLDGVDQSMYEQPVEQTPSYEEPVVGGGSAEYEEPIVAPATYETATEAEAGAPKHNRLDYINATAIQENYRRKQLKPKQSSSSQLNSVTDHQYVNSDAIDDAQSDWA